MSNPWMSNTPLGVPQLAPHGQFLDQGSPPYIRTTGSMLEDTDHHRVRPELSYYGTYGFATHEPQDPQVTSFPPEVANPRLGPNPRGKCSGGTAFSPNTRHA